MKQLFGAFRNERPRECGECHHPDHHVVGFRDKPCFFPDPTQDDGFCVCGRERLAPRNSVEFAEMILGPEVAPNKSHCGICEYPIIRLDPTKPWRHRLPRSPTIEMSQEETVLWASALNRWTHLTTGHDPIVGWPDGDDRD